MSDEVKLPGSVEAEILRIEGILDARLPILRRAIAAALRRERADGIEAGHEEADWEEVEGLRAQADALEAKR